MTLRNAVAVLNLGRMRYARALQVQKGLERVHLDLLAGKSQRDPRDTLVVVEHDPVYTIGIRTQGFDEKEEKRLKDLGAEFHRTNRGGLITYHGPGQLVIYPIINLGHYKRSVRWYVSRLEQTVIDACDKYYNIKAHITPNRNGVWIGNNKLCSVGIHASRFVTTHGIALNCNVDFKWYKHIDACGYTDAGVTSLTNELGTRVTPLEALPAILDAFGENFGCSFYNYPSDEKVW